MTAALKVKSRSGAVEVVLSNNHGEQAKMSSNMDTLIAKAKELARKDDNQSAMSLANDLIEKFPNEVRVWSLRGYLHGRNSNHIEAVSDLTRAIDINSVDPYLFFSRGVDRFELGDYQLP